MLTDSNKRLKHLFMARAEPATTKERLIAAASELFAERGFHGTRVRDIAARASVNLAAGNYHYGSKKALYLEVLRAQFGEVRALFSRRRVSRPANEIRRLSQEQVESLLEARIRAMLDILIGPPPGLHGTLMQREMTDPTEALPVIVDEFIDPMRREMSEIITRLKPDLEPLEVDRCVMSIVGQAIFFRFAMPAVLRIIGRPAYPRGFAHERAAHITAFSLGGMERVTNQTRRRRHDRKSR